MHKQNRLFRGSSNHIEARGLVDYSNRDAEGQPTDVISGVTVTAQVFSPDRATALHTPAITLTQEADQPQNYYRGLLDNTVNFGAHETVAIKYIIDGGGPTAYQVRWLDGVEVVDS